MTVSCAPRRHAHTPQPSAALIAGGRCLPPVGLGTWQISGWPEKDALIAAVDARLRHPGDPAPAEQWASLDPKPYDFRPVTVTGTFRYDQDTVTVSHNRLGARCEVSGPGYWVDHALRLDGRRHRLRQPGLRPAGPAGSRRAPTGRATTRSTSRVLPLPGEARRHSHRPTIRRRSTGSIPRLAAMAAAASARSPHSTSI